MQHSLHHTYVNPLPVHAASLETLSFQLFLATSSKLFVYALPTTVLVAGRIRIAEDGISDNKGLDVIQTMGLPSISGVPSGSSITFRAAR